MLQGRVGPDTAKELIGDLIFGQELTELVEQPASLNAPASVDKKRTASAVFADLLCLLKLGIFSEDNFGRAMICKCMHDKSLLF